MPKQHTPVTIRDPHRVVRFGSRVGTSTGRALSNFHKITLRLHRRDYPSLVLETFPLLKERFPDEETEAVFTSTEAAWQALKARNLYTFRRFESHGDIGGEVTPASFAPFLPKKWRTDLEKRQSKYFYWIESKHGIRYDNVGIISKMAANPKYGKVLQLGPENMQYDREYLAPDIEKAVWIALLKAKVDQNRCIRDILKTRKGCQFVEFSRSAKARHESGKKEDYWAGYDDVQGGKIYGINRMGHFIELLAKEF